MTKQFLLSKYHFRSLFNNAKKGILYMIHRSKDGFLKIGVGEDGESETELPELIAMAFGGDDWGGGAGEG